MTSSASESSSTLSSGTTSRSLSISAVPAAYPVFERRRLTGPRHPAGLAAAVEALARAILRERPDDIYSFAAQHFHYLVQSRITNDKPPKSAQRKKVASSVSTRRFCSTEDSGPRGVGRSVENRRKAPKKECDRNDDAAGWSIRETSKILKKQAVFPSKVDQIETKEDDKHSSGNSKIPRASCPSPPVDSSSLLSETDGRNAPGQVIRRDSAVGESANPEDVETQMVRPRRGSLELVELLDTQYPREGTARLLRSVSFDCILPRWIDHHQSRVSDEIPPTRSIIAATVRSNSATSDVPSLRPTKQLKDDNNTNKKKAGPVFLPAVRSSRGQSTTSPPASSFSSTFNASSSSSSSSYCLPAADSSRDHQPDSGRTRGSNGSTTLLPLLKSDLANKSAKKCNYPLVLPAVACGISTGATVGLALSEGQSAFAAVEGSAADAAVLSNDVDVEERLRLNELGKKLLALEMVERKIERRLVLGGGTPEELVFTRNDPMGKNEEQATADSEERRGVGLTSVTQVMQHSLQKDSIEGDWQLPEDDTNKQETCGSKHSQLSDSLFDDRLNVDIVDSSEQEEAIGADDGGSSDPYKIAPTIGNTIIVPGAGRVELEEITEEAEGESVGRADYESRVIKSILAENLEGMEMETEMTALGNGMPMRSTVNPPSASRNNSRALEDIAESESETEIEKKVPENEKQLDCLANDSSALLKGKWSDRENLPDESNDCDQDSHLTVGGLALEGSVTPSTPLIHQGDTSFEEEIAKELIENGKSEDFITFPLQVPSLSQESTDTQGEKSVASGLDDASLVLRVCHTGEFHDCLPLHLFNELASSSSMTADTDNMLQMQRHEVSDEATTIVSERSAVNGNRATTEPAESLALSNSEGSFHTGQTVSVPQSSQVLLSREQPFPLSGTFSSNNFPSATTQFIHPLTFQAIPQDQLSICTAIRTLPTNFETFIPFIPYPNAPLYISYSNLPIPADLYNIFQDSTLSDGTSVTIEELPNANATPQDQVQGIEIGPAIDSVAASTPNPSADASSLEEFQRLEENTHSN